MKSKFLPSLFFLIGVIWVFLMILNRSYANIYFGLCFFIAGIIVLIQRVLFDILPKDRVIGRIIEVRKEVDDGGTSYCPIFEYTYNDKKEIYRSLVSSFTFKWSKHIGDQEEILVLKKNPKRVRLNKFSYVLLEYLVSPLFIFRGINIL